MVVPAGFQERPKSIAYLDKFSKVWGCPLSDSQT